MGCAMMQGVRGLLSASLLASLVASSFRVSDSFQISSVPLASTRRASNSFFSTLPQHQCGECGSALSSRRRQHNLSWSRQTLAGATTALSSLKHLVDDVSTSSGPKTIFVGGKGGVGKTSVSSALAVALASDYETDQRVLVVSTDPAHSLGDALDCDLKSGGVPVPMTDSLTMGRLYACEIDSAKALESFRSALEAFDVSKLSDALGVSPDLLQGFGLTELSGLLNNPPPGLDELVALSNVLDSDLAREFDVVIVDTAPTGHTLRMLSLPKFLDGFLGKLIGLRLKLNGLSSALQAFFGSKQAEQRANTIDTALNKLEEFRKKVSSLRNKLQDKKSTSFVVVTIPSKLGVNESKRLIHELRSQGVAVTDVVVNQCVGDIDGNAADAMLKYYDRRKSGQTRWLKELRVAIDAVSSTDEFKSNGGSDPIALTEVPFFDVELIGVPALAYVGQQTFTNNPHYDYLFDNSDSEDKAKFVICGGKGGVGKTTTSSSLAVAMAAAGHDVALVSTDPAHSLGDVFDMSFAGGELIDVPLIGVPPTDGSLSVMEIDPSRSLDQFKELVKQLISKAPVAKEQESSDVGKTLRDLGDIFDTLPAGTDEVVALAKVVGVIKRASFDRIVLDTAPTGHTLRMLSTPAFVSNLIERVVAIGEKVNSNSMVKMLITSRARGEDIDATFQATKNALLSFQFQMYYLEDLFSNADQTEFLIVTVPTELAVRESVRLLNDLTFEAPDMPIKVRNIVANQILSGDNSDVGAFLHRVTESQKTSICNLKDALGAMEAPFLITEVPYLDTEPRGVFGLKALAAELMRED